jgi:hypothetical protein
MERTYKGYQIVTRCVGNKGYNIVCPNGRVKIGPATIKECEGWISNEIYWAEINA